MTYWFHEHYASPVEDTPYNSEEGGYQFVWGGPYEAKEELENRFSGIASDEAINQVAEELDDISDEWAGQPSEAAFDDWLFDVIGTSDAYLNSLHNALRTVELSMRVRVPSDLEQNFLRMLYGNVISALEAYLFDFFVRALKRDPALVRILVEKNKDFQTRKIPLSEVFKQHEEIQTTIQEFLLGLSWHNLPRIEPLYKDVLGIAFDTGYKGNLLPAIAVRHDIVHRNGKTKEVTTCPSLRRTSPV